MDYAELAKFGLAGLSAGLIYVLVTIINNNFKERSAATAERLEAAKLMSESIQRLSQATEYNTRVTNNLNDYIRIRNGIGDKTSQALAHALEQLGVKPKKEKHDEH